MKTDVNEESALYLKAKICDFWGVSDYMASMQLKNGLHIMKKNLKLSIERIAKKSCI